MSFIIPIVREGDGTTFNRGETKPPQWAGRWGEYYFRKRYPLTWRLRKVMNIVTKH